MRRLTSFVHHGVGEVPSTIEHVRVIAPAEHVALDKRDQQENQEQSEQKSHHFVSLEIKPKEKTLFKK